MAHVKKKGEKAKKSRKVRSWSRENRRYTPPKNANTIKPRKNQNRDSDDEYGDGTKHKVDTRRNINKIRDKQRHECADQRKHNRD